MAITDNLIQEMQVANDSPKRYFLRSAADALKPQPPVEWIINNLFSAGSVSLVVGEAGSKKTWALLDAAVCIACGSDWLNFQTAQGGALIIDEDNGERKLTARLNKILTAHEATESTPVYYVSLAAFDLGNVDDVAELHMLIMQTNARIVIIDTLAGIMPGRDENSVKDVQPVFLSLRRTAERTGAAIVVIHHTNKIGGYRGSSALKGAVDLMLMVESKPDSLNIDFKTEKARDTEPINFAAVANFMPDKFWLNQSPTQGRRTTFNKGQKYVLRYLRENKSRSMFEIKSNADSCSETTARDAVYSLVDAGLVFRVDGGGQGVTAVFALTEKGIDQAEGL